MQINAVESFYACKGESCKWDQLLDPKSKVHAQAVLPVDTAQMEREEKKNIADKRDIIERTAETLQRKCVAPAESHFNSQLTAGLKKIQNSIMPH